MTTINVISRDGSTKAVTAEPGQSLMELIRDAGFDELLAMCGGCCSCATCHVIVDPDWYAKTGGPSEDEEDMLDLAFSLSETSRLGCQIAMTPELDGLRLTVPEDF